ncbi:MAG TPA: hypothetical protein VJ769_09520, partial [Actinomycetes bacterium]|nr:hypothetical protein [Actinomycetes bacterium]
YWPVSYQFGDPTVISNRGLPLSGVRFSEIMRGVGEIRASLQLADDEVRALYPWDKVIPRKTGIVVVRDVFDDSTGTWISEAVQHYIVLAAPRDPETGRMEIMGLTIEAAWARRLITKAITWSGVDQTTIAADLLDPTKWSKTALGPNPWPGWITVDPPTNPTGVTRDFSYADGQESNLLEAHQNRSQLATNSYEWTTKPRVLSGTDAASANTFRIQYVLGFPKLGRLLTDTSPAPRLRYDRNGGGNVVSYKYQHDGSQCANIVWGRGKGYEDLQAKTVVSVPEWLNGFLQSETRFSDPDVESVSTLADYCNRFLLERLGSEQFLAKLTLRGDRAPFFGTYVIGDEVTLDTNDSTWPDDMLGPDGFLSLDSRIFGWTVTPPQGGTAETVELVISGGDLA